jgi:hypothetical protein
MHFPTCRSPVGWRRLVEVTHLDRLQPLTLELRTMQFRGLPPAKSVEQAILLAQLQILRQMEKTRG